MRYGKLGRTGMDTSIIGLGMEHLPAVGMAPVVQRAIDGGVSYIDLMMWTAETQEAFSLALAGRRDRVILAGHLGVAQTKGMYRKTRNVQESEALFHDLLRRLRTDHVDVLHFTYVDKIREWSQIVQPGGVLELALRLKREGKARFLGLSGHDAKTAMQAVESGYLDVLMHPVGIDRAADPLAGSLYHLCASRGVGLVAMKTFAGGALLRRDKPATPIQCISYTLSQPGVATALVGASNLAELQADLQFLRATEEEKDFASALEGLKEGLQGICVYCRHCHPCPAQIDIPAILRLVAASERGVSTALHAGYQALAAKASSCDRCGACVKRCPFGVDVLARMSRATELFEKGPISSESAF